ncbi:MAG TPA: ATP-binding protein [Candidatus Aquilonibacter sp.]|jgi:signal transduction histidine kinase|nr:ATP-binding protein [Candidatus Aquilonibacter sp.]
MKSLFLKIFLSFWAALALFLVLAILVMLAFRTQRNSTWDTLRTTALTEATLAYEQGGTQPAHDYLENLQRTHHVRAYVFDEQGNEISGRSSQGWAEHVAAGKPLPPHPGMIFPRPQILTESKASSDGRHFYTIAMELPPGPRVFFGPWGIPMPGLIILVISSGIVCYFLAWYMTKPVVRLRAATQQLAAGDLTARAGSPNSKGGDEIAGLVRDFDTMAGRLENLVNAQSRLLNDISHELRSPLARLNVALGLARQRSGAESASMLERIELEASRLNELIGRLLTLARLEDGEQSVPSNPILVDEIVLNIAEDAEFEAQARHCHVRSEIPSGNWAVRGEASLLHSAIENVVRNAIRYTREGSTVEIHLERVDSPKRAEAVISVTDCGSGVPADALEKLFQPFYRLDDDRGRQTGGVGLGLAITERAVRFHGGRVAAFNRAEGGLLVEIHLPLMPGSVDTRETFERAPISAISG